MCCYTFHNYVIIMLIDYETLKLISWTTVCVIDKMIDIYSCYVSHVKSIFLNWSLSCIFKFLFWAFCVCYENVFFNVFAQLIINVMTLYLHGLLSCLCHLINDIIFFIVPLLVHICKHSIKVWYNFYCTMSCGCWWSTTLDSYIKYAHSDT